MIMVKKSGSRAGSGQVKSVEIFVREFPGISDISDIFSFLEVMNQMKDGYNFWGYGYW